MFDDWFDRQPWYYILDGHEVVPLGKEEIMRWGEFMENIEARRVGYDELPGDVAVSTVFLGHDHSFSAEGPPLVFETAIIRPRSGRAGRDYEIVGRWSTWNQAAEMHERHVSRLAAVTN